jgi:hypothetical protein
VIIVESSPVASDTTLRNTHAAAIADGSTPSFVRPTTPTQITPVIGTAVPRLQAKSWRLRTPRIVSSGLRMARARAVSGRSFHSETR